jgi:6-pyruvoyltetrahydropterin/6-carboxytetrahydropterin synthase
MSERFKISVARDHLVFCCGHFISYDGHQCERLHGHNYRAAVSGPSTSTAARELWPCRRSHWWPA